MHRSLVTLLVFLPLLLAVEVQGTERNAHEESSSAPKRYGISVEGDAWYTMWEGLGHGSLNYTDYDIGSTMIYGVTVSGFYRTRSSTWFGLGVSYLADFLQQETIKAAGGEDLQRTTEIINGLLLFNFGKNYHFYSRVLWGRFNGVLQADQPFGWSTDWLIADLLWVSPPAQEEPGVSATADRARQLADKPWFGIGFRVIRYDQPMEIQFYRDGALADSTVANIRHRAYCLYAKMMDSSHFGIPTPQSLFYYEAGLGFGVAVDGGDHLEENLYGFDFTFDLDVGLKYAWVFKHFSVGVRGGYRLLGDMFILSRWKVPEGEANTTTTQINLFHGPFVSANVAF